VDVIFKHLVFRWSEKLLETLLQVGRKIKKMEPQIYLGFYERYGLAARFSIMSYLVTVVMCISSRLNISHMGEEMKKLWVGILSGLKVKE